MVFYKDSERMPIKTDESWFVEGETIVIIGFVWSQSEYLGLFDSLVCLWAASGNPAVINWEIYVCAQIHLGASDILSARNLKYLNIG